MNKPKPKTTAEIVARMTEIAEMFRDYRPGDPPNYKALALEHRQLTEDFAEAEAREVVQPTAEHLRKVREAEEREARISRAWEEASR